MCTTFTPTEWCAVRTLLAVCALFAIQARADAVRPYMRLGRMVHILGTLAVS